MPDDQQPGPRASPTQRRRGCISAGESRAAAGGRGRRRSGQWGPLEHGRQIAAGMASEQWRAPGADRCDPPARGIALCLQVSLGSASGSLAHRPARSPPGVDACASTEFGGGVRGPSPGRHPGTHASQAWADHPAGSGVGHRKCHPGHRDRRLSHRPAAGGGARPGGSHPQLLLSHRNVAGELGRLPPGWPLRLAGRLYRLCRADAAGGAFHP